MINDKVYKIIEEFFQSLPSRYQIRLEKSMEHSDFLISCAWLLYYKYHETKANWDPILYRFSGLDKKIKKQQ